MIIQIAESPRNREVGEENLGDNRSHPETRDYSCNNYIINKQNSEVRNIAKIKINCWILIIKSLIKKLKIKIVNYKPTPIVKI